MAKGETISRTKRAIDSAIKGKGAEASGCGKTSWYFGRPLARLVSEARAVFETCAFAGKARKQEKRRQRKEAYARMAQSLACSRPVLG